MKGEGGEECWRMRRYISGWRRFVVSGGGCGRVEVGAGGWRRVLVVKEECGRTLNGLVESGGKS